MNSESNGIVQVVAIANDTGYTSVKNYTGARARDRELFHQLVGEKLKSDGRRFSEGTYEWHQFYDAFCKWKRKRSIDWPGKMLEKIADDSPQGVGDWLTYLGLESV
jgi:hypothetical protein